MERTSNKSGHTPVVWPLPGKSAIFLLRSYFWHHYQHLWLPLSSTIDCIKNSFQSFNSLWYVHVFAAPEQLRHFHTEHSATWVRTCIQGLVSMATVHRQPGNGSLRVHCCESEFHSHFFFFWSSVYVFDICHLEEPRFNAHLPRLYKNTSGDWKICIQFLPIAQAQCMNMLGGLMKLSNLKQYY